MQLEQVITIYSKKASCHHHHQIFTYAPLINLDSSDGRAFQVYVLVLCRWRADSRFACFSPQNGAAAIFFSRSSPGRVGGAGHRGFAAAIAKKKKKRPVDQKNPTTPKPPLGADDTANLGPGSATSSRVDLILDLQPPFLTERQYFYTAGVITRASLCRCWSALASQMTTSQSGSSGLSFASTCFHLSTIW